VNISQLKLRSEKFDDNNNNNNNNNNNRTHFLVLEDKMNFLPLTEPNPIDSLGYGKVSQQ
jgi:hypothetical protein